jgi:hypothetical protein
MSNAGLSPDGKTLVATSADQTTVQLWEFGMRGQPALITLWVQVVTGMELDEHGTVRVLDAAAWRQRRQRLTELGGPPLP